MKTILYASDSRGYFDHGWLKTHHSFSFASYINPERMNFGLLRVFNDDYIESGEGFGKHFHDNMEIITIPFQGALEHKDSTGTSQIISNNEVQVMSAGSGIYHSEFSKSETEYSNIFQLWIFPKKRDVTPRYDQLKFNASLWLNNFYSIVKPEGNKGLWINQDSFIVRGDFCKGMFPKYTIQHKGNGVYLFLVQGKIKIGEHVLTDRDSIGIWDCNEIIIEVTDDSKLILVDVPMK